VLTPPHSQLNKQQSSLSQETYSAMSDENNHQKESICGSGSDLAVKPKKRSIQDLTESEKEDTMAMLEDNIENMRYEFARLVSRTRKSMKERVSPHELSGCVLDLKAFPIESGKEDATFKEHREELINADDIPKLFQILSSYWSFLDYEVLKFIIDEHGSKDDKINLQNYDQKLNAFCRNHVFEVSQLHDDDEHPKQTKLCFKLQLTRECLNHKRIKRRLAKILNVMPSTLHICCIEKGCIQLTILMPKFVSLEMFPLSEDQKVELSKASVLKLEHDHCVEFQVLLS